MIIKIIVTIVSMFVVGIIGLQFQSFKDWLVWACTEAEAYFGNKTGALKLAYVYNLAIERFPFISKVITYKTFNWFVGKALRTMKEMIQNNSAIATVVENNLLIKETPSEEPKEEN